MDKATLIATYGTDDIAVIAQRKSAEKQTRVYAGKGPTKVPMAADECRKMCEKIGKEYLPGYESRVLSYMTTNETADRYGDVVRATGARLDAYMKNPVVMFSHQHDNFPVGASLKVWVDKKEKAVPAQALFLDDRVDSSGRADLVYKFAASGFMPACSIGFMPLKVNRPATQEDRVKVGVGEYGVEFLEWDYLEFSPCAIPANPDALQNALKSCDFKSVAFEQKDIDTLALAKWMDENMLDQFVQTITGKVGRTFVVPSIVVDKEIPTDQPVVPVPATAPVAETATTSDTGVVIHNITISAPVTMDMAPILEAVKAITEPLTNLITTLESRTAAITQALEKLASARPSPGVPGDDGKRVDDIYSRVFAEGVKVRIPGDKQ